MEIQDPRIPPPKALTKAVVGCVIFIIAMWYEDKLHEPGQRLLVMAAGAGALFYFALDLIRWWRQRP
jgi:hypothetical protein